MRLLRTAAIVLLLASLLSNALLLARGVGHPDSKRAPAAGSLEQSRALGQIMTLRERNEILKERIRELESSPASVRPPVSAASDEPDAPTFRERLRRYLEVIGTEDAYDDPERTLAISETSLEFMRACVQRTNDPAAYGERLRELFDALLHDQKLKLAADQSMEFKRILEEYRQAVLNVRTDSVPEQYSSDLEIEAAAMARTKALLNPEQYGRTMSILSDLGFFIQPMVYWGITSEGAEETIAGAWTDAYRLDESQKPAVQEAARSFAETLRQLERQNRGKPGSQWEKMKDYDSRIRLQQSQIAALKLLENVMTPDQKERFRSRQMIDFSVQAPREAGK